MRRWWVVMCVAFVAWGCGSGFARDVDDDDGAGGAGASGPTSATGQSAVSTGQSSVAATTGVGAGGTGPEGMLVAHVSECDQLLAVEPESIRTQPTVYTTSIYGVHRVVADGTSQLETIYPGGTFNFQTKDLVLAEDGIYLTGYGGITKIDYDGNPLGNNTTLNEVISVAVGAIDIFFTRVNEGAIYHASPDPTGTNNGLLFAGASNEPHAGGIAANDTDVYWAAGGKLYMADQLGTGEVELFNDASFKASPGSVVLDDTHVYWGSLTGIYRMPLGGGVVDLLASGAPWAIAVDATHVYWTQDNRVLRVPVSGGSAELVAQYGDISGYYIAVDSKNVYWIGCVLGDGPAGVPTQELRAIGKL